MSLSKSWGMTIFVYVVTIAAILSESFTGVHLSDSAIMGLVSLTGLSTAGGTANSVLSNRGEMTKIMNEILELKKKIV